MAAFFFTLLPSDGSSVVPQTHLLKIGPSARGSTKSYLGSFPRSYALKLCQQLRPAPLVERTYEKLIPALLIYRDQR